jgi:hypothetical protein
VFALRPSCGRLPSDGDREPGKQETLSASSDSGFSPAPVVERKGDASVFTQSSPSARPGRKPRSSAECKGVQLFSQSAAPRPPQVGPLGSHKTMSSVNKRHWTPRKMSCRLRLSDLLFAPRRGPRCARQSVVHCQSALAHVRRCVSWHVATSRPIVGYVESLSRHEEKKRERDSARTGS